MMGFGRRGMDMIWIVMSAVVAIAFGYILFTTLSDKLAGSGKAIDGLTDCGSGLAMGIIFGDNTVHGTCGGPLKDCEDAEATLRSTPGFTFPDGGRMQYVGEGWGCPPKGGDQNKKYCCLVLGGEENPIVMNCDSSSVTECRGKKLGDVAKSWGPTATDTCEYVQNCEKEPGTTSKCKLSAPVCKNRV